MRQRQSSTHASRLSVEERAAKRVFIPYLTQRGAETFIASRGGTGHVEWYSKGPGYVAVLPATAIGGQDMVCGARGTWRVANPTSDSMRGGTRFIDSVYSGVAPHG
jgi:hypothetical protein